MKGSHWNRKILAWACGAALFAGMSLATVADPPQHKKKKHEQPHAQKLKQDRKHYDQRLTMYRHYLDQQQKFHQQRLAQLQKKKRMAQYRYQQQYLARMLQLHKRYENAWLHDYQQDPFFQTAFDRRYNRGGTYYETNRYGIEHLQQATQYGYAEGFQAGMADRQDRWRAAYELSDVYQDANYGFNGYTVSQDDYSYYFREGFRRGYEDGYNKRYQYGRYANGNYTLLDTILAAIIPFEMLR